MEEQVKKCSHEGCEASSICDDCNGCEAHCTCGSSDPDNPTETSVETSGSESTSEATADDSTEEKQ